VHNLVRCRCVRLLWLKLLLWLLLPMLVLRWSRRVSHNSYEKDFFRHTVNVPHELYLKLQMLIRPHLSGYHVGLVNEIASLSQSLEASKCFRWAELWDQVLDVELQVFQRVGVLQVGQQGLERQGIVRLC